MATATDWWLAAAGLTLLVVLAYGNSFGAGFVLDNEVIILNDPRLRAATAENLGSILNRGYWWPYAELGLYRPLTTLTYLFNYTVLGNATDPAGYHAINLLLHLANVLLLCALVAWTTRLFWVAVVAAAVVAVHPVNTEAVTNIVGRADLLSGFGVLGALYAHVRATDSNEPHPLRWRAVECLAAAIGMFSKENAIALIGVIALYDVLRSGRIRLKPDPTSRHLEAPGPALPRSVARLLTGWLPVLVPAALFLFQRWQVLSAVTTPDSFPFVDNPILGASFWTGRLTALAVAGRYLGLIVWPAALSADYSYSQIPLATGTASEWAAWLAVGCMVAAAVGLWFQEKRLAFLAILAAAIMFAPVSNLLVTSGTVMAERLLYVPLLFLAPVAAAGTLTLAESPGRRRMVLGVLGAVVVAMAIRTQIRNRDWRDDLSIWSATARTAPRSFKAHSGLADSLYKSDPSRANLAQVIAEKDASLAILASIPDPAETSRPYYEAAVYHAERGERLSATPESSPAAAESYERAAALLDRYFSLTVVRAVPEADVARARALQSVVYARLSRGERAIESARASLASEPLNPLAYRTLATALAGASRADDAAIALMTGFMLTGDVSLRQLVIDLYRGGLDTAGCAVSAGPSGVVLNSSCALVARHFCAAAADAARVHRQRGEPELADQALLLVRELDCRGIAAR